MDASVDVQLRVDDAVFDGSDAALLRAIDESGSVRAAADGLGRSRARALSRIDVLEVAFGSLVDRKRGGARGGGSELTGTARELLARYDRLRATLVGTANVAESVLPGTISAVDGELGVVETDAGVVRARLVADASGDRPAVGRRVQVGVRSDAVTVHAPPDSPPADGTSARNRFEGVVAGIDRNTAVANVTVDVDGSEPFVALLTRDSLDRLSLSTGTPVVVTFKATATRAIPVE